MNNRDIVKIRSGWQVGRLVALAVLAIGVAKADRLDTISYNFPVDNGGGGASAILNQTNYIEIYCNDFNNDIWVPRQNYSATVSTITAGALNATRFGRMTAADFRAVTISDGDGTDTSEQNTINHADAYARYEMVAYLVSQYNFAGQGSLYNDRIQLAIWEIMDPTAYGTPNQFAPGVDATDALEMAADWYMGTNDTQRQAQLANYRIVSDATMVCTPGTSGCNYDAPLQGGFQEQITTVPEPAAGLPLAFGLIGILAARRRARRKA